MTANADGADVHTSFVATSHAAGDGVSPRTGGAARFTRGELVRAAADRWVDQLIDLGGRNTLLYFKDLKQGTLDLGPATRTDPGARRALLEGRGTRVSMLWPDVDERAVAARRARTITAKAQENFEERGLDTLHVGWGMATWTPRQGTATPAAPLLLGRVTMRAHGAAAEDFHLERTDEWEVNPTLLHLLSTEFQVRPDLATLAGLLDEEDQEDALGLLDRVAAALDERARDVPGWSWTPRLVLGNFSYAKLPLVRDLQQAGEALAAHDLIAAIAGDREAHDAIRGHHVAVDLDLPDRMKPADEFLVLDADASQSYVINAALAGADLVVEGPPGTGKSQTIANLIVTLIARGKRVLFVAEKRAAIDAVLGRLGSPEVDLADLVLDLHDGAGNKRAFAQELGRAMADLGTVPRPGREARHRALERERQRLRDQSHALHRAREPWGFSVYDVQAALLGLPERARADLRFPRSVLARLDAQAVEAAEVELREYVELGGLPLEAGVGPWAPALRESTIRSPDDARAVLDALLGVRRGSLPAVAGRLAELVESTGLLAPRNLQGWQERLALLDGVAETLQVLAPQVFEEPMADLVEALTPADRGAWARMMAAIGNPAYRAATRRMREHWRQGKPRAGELFRAVQAAQQQQAEWSRMAQGHPTVPADLEQTAAAYQQLGAELRALSAYVGTTSWGDLGEDELDQQLGGYLADQEVVYRLPRLHELRNGLMDRGLGPLLQLLSARRADSVTALDTLAYVLRSSVLEEVRLEDPAIGAFEGSALRHTVEEFQGLDSEHIQTGPARVRRAWAERATEARNQFREESGLLEQQAKRKRGHKPIRELMSAAPNVLGTLKPCWAMSPLVVSQLLPAEPIFDVVVFDEASQISPPDAIPALLRGRRAVVAGDSKQLPPTRFFLSETPIAEDDEESNALTEDVESLLGVMGVLLPAPVGTRTLGWHYRSRDERLIAFSNAQPSLYGWGLTTFPGASDDGCLTHVHVTWRPGRVEKADSSADEVAAVVDAVLHHVQERPDESLGIIAMSRAHADRISEALRLARAAYHELRRYDEQVHEPLFVKNLERVQGDERDAVILSIGYGKSADGRMQYRFGPLNIDGGERRLNVAITRARRRMTVVSSFLSVDLDPDRLRAEGARLLGAYLAYVESGGTDLGRVTRRKPELNPFERDVQAGLESAGIPVVAQWGASGYWIDFVAKHPEQPGRMVLAIEADGATYHSSPTARDRDRLRQQHLENLGWRFHRIWSQDWFRHRDGEIERAATAYAQALAAQGERSAAPELVRQPEPLGIAREPARGPRPSVPAGYAITDYRRDELVALVAWISSDTLLRTREQLLTETMRELGFQRRGARIEQAITAAINEAVGSGS